MLQTRSGEVQFEGIGSALLGVSRAPTFARNLAIYDTSLERTTGAVGHIAASVHLEDGTVLFQHAGASSRAQTRKEMGGPIAVFQVPAQAKVEFRISSGRADPTHAFGSVTFAFIK